MTVVSNTGPLIHLSWIHRLDLLNTLFGEIHVPTAVAQEALAAHPATLGLSDIREAFAADWIREVAQGPVAESLALPPKLHHGETAAIALALAENADILLLDDRDARVAARRKGIPITGTIGILMEARNQLLIPSAYELVSTIHRLGFRVGVELLVRLQKEEGL